MDRLWQTFPTGMQKCLPIPLSQYINDETSRIAFPYCIDNQTCLYNESEKSRWWIFIFNRHSLIRDTLIVTRRILSCMEIITIGMKMNAPFSNGVLAPFILLLNGLMTSSRCFVLDRMNGTLTFPRHLFFRTVQYLFQKLFPNIPMVTDAYMGYIRYEWVQTNAL